jgi:NAD(P)H dehydrogenase (quinone)
MRALIVFNGNRESVIGSEVMNAVTSTLDRNGHHVDVIDLLDSSFEPVMTSAERRAYMTNDPISDPVVQHYAELVGQAELLIFVYRSRLTTIPPSVKGWLEKVLVPGVAFHFDAQGKVRPSLTQVRRIIGITAYNDGWFAVRRQFDAGRRTITRALRLNTGWRTRTQWIGLYDALAATSEQRAAFLSRIEHQLEQL